VPYCSVRNSINHVAQKCQQGSVHVPQCNSWLFPLFLLGALGLSSLGALGLCLTVCLRIGGNGYVRSHFKKSVITHTARDYKFLRSNQHCTNSFKNRSTVLQSEWCRWQLENQGRTNRPPAKLTTDAKPGKGSHFLIAF
jgi:hypothetical protein